MVREVVEFGPPLSKIAVSKAHGEDSPYFAGWKAYDEDPYDAASNPFGVIQMGLAENQVSFDLVEDYLENHREIYSWGSSGISSFKDNALFQDYCGLSAFRKAMASFMEQIRGKRVKFDPERIVLSAGATAANELLTFILADPGDAFLVPTPFYPGFIRDIQWRTGARMVPVPCHSSDAFQLTIDSLQAAYSRAKACNLRVKALLITNPSNPLGTTIPRPLLEDILDFVASKSIHLISDEIYSGSVFSSPEDFVSVAELVEFRGGGQKFPGVHIVYSLSKDLGLPGFRVGAIYSYNDSVVATARRMSSFSLVSSQTQMLLASMLSDEDFTSRYVRINKERLERRRARIVGGLKDAGIECLDGNAGLFCWMNLAPLLDEGSVEGELRLWRMMLSEAKLNVSPGSSCCCAEAGWFRVCFANMSEQTLDVALERIKAFADEVRKRNNKIIIS